MAEKNPTPQSHDPLAGLTAGLTDEIDESLHPLLQKILDNIKLIVGVIAVLILAVGGVAVYDAVQQSGYQEAQASLSEILAKPEATQRVEALEAFVQKAPGAMTTAVRLELASSLSDAGEHERAAQTWDQIRKDAPESMDVLARFGEAAELARAGKHAQAMNLLEGMKTSVPESFKQLLTQRLAYEAEMAGEYEKALSNWEDLLTENETRMTPFFEAKIREMRDKLQGNS